MRILHRLSALIIGFALVTPLPALAQGDRLALLIGNSRYEEATPLRNPENDVEIMASSLRATGFQTFVGKNASQKDMSRLITEFVTTAQRKQRPTLLVYFAGHGVQLGDVNYLIPVDASAGSADKLQQTSLSATSLLERLVSANPSLVMLILDACRDNPFENASRSLRRGLGELSFKSENADRSGQLIAFATAPGTTADDGDAGNSPYASALAETIISPGLSLEAVFREARRKVVDRTKGQQQPWERVSLFADFFFIPPDAKPKPNTDEATFWDLASIVNSAEIYQRYLDRFPTGTFSDLARRKIAAINTDFSYRRKAEVFPIMKLSHAAFPACTDKNAYRFEDGIRKRFSALEGQIVYVTLSFPVNWLYCRNRDGQINYNFLQFVRDARGQCGLFFFSSDGIDSARTACAAPDQMHYNRAINVSQFFKDGGLLIGANSETSILIPGGQTEHHAFRFEYAEGDTSEMRAEFSGLVRLKTFKAESDLTAVLEPVDPRALGISWKFDNTVAAAKQQPDTDLGLIAARHIEPSPPPRSEPSFTVLGNRTMTGHDIRHVKGLDEKGCARLCEGDPRCRAYLIDKWNRWCFLKDGVSDMRVDPKYNLGLKAGVAPPAQSTRPREIVYFRGKQFPDAGAFYPAADYRACGQRCLSVTQCVAFTFDRKAGWPAPCKLLGSAGEYFSRSGADSGVTRQER